MVPTRQVRRSLRRSAEDLRCRVHAMLPAPGQVERALGFRVDGLDDLAVFAEILDAASHLDVHHAWLVTDRSHPSTVPAGSYT